MPEPKPLDDAGKVLEDCLNASTSFVPVSRWQIATAELAKLRADAEKWRATKPVLKTFLLEFIAKLEPYWDDDDA